MKLNKYGKRECYCNKCDTCRYIHSIRSANKKLRKKLAEQNSVIKTLLGLFRKKEIQLENEGFTVPSRMNFNDMD